MSADYFPCFDEVHVVSDLHLGGREARFQIFNQGQRLANTIKQLAGRPADRLALVLNGDVVDFLAEAEGRVYLDVEGATDKLQRIINDPSFCMVWQALKEFVATPKRYLVFVLGNHDVELALPPVRHWLADWLAQGNALNKADAIRGRLIWAADGTGFSCRVGGRRVLCVHGNEMDDWNVVDHLALMQLIRGWARGMASLPEWTPNAGTRLVIDVMNKIKADFPMVDLLKPEMQAAVPMVAALDPSRTAAIGEVLKTVMKKTVDGLRMKAGFLGEDGPASAEPVNTAEALRTVLAPLTPSDDLKGDKDWLRERMLESQSRIDRHVPPYERESRVEASQFLGPEDGFNNVKGWFNKDNRSELLRKALIHWLLREDRTWKLDDDKEAQFVALDRAVDQNVHYLIAGHTHLRRAHPRKSSDTYYYNTGTWIRLIQLDHSSLTDMGEFGKIMAAFDKQPITALDNTTLKSGPLVKHEPTVASVCRKGDTVEGTLNHVKTDGAFIPLAIDGTLTNNPLTDVGEV
jgi:UDP-2,3-diacylglucosamine pyrophosphatase LpxH